MIVKHFQFNDDIINKSNYFLLYGDNEGLKNELIKKLKQKGDIFTYDEKEVLDSESDFIENLLSKSLFEEKKIIIIKRATDKIAKIVEILREKEVEDTKLIVSSYTLDKKSKLRNLFEKNKKLICTPFYPDNYQSLSKITENFFFTK